MKSYQEYSELIHFFWGSLSMAAATSLSAAPAGTLVLLRRDSLIALALPQMVVLGVVIALRNEWHPLFPSLVVVAALLAVIGWAKSKHLSEFLLPTLYVACIAIVIVLVKNHAQHLGEVQSMYTGIDVGVSEDEARWPSRVLLVTIVPLLLFWRRWLLLAQAPATAQIARVHVPLWHGLYLALLTTIVLVSSYQQGPVLVTAMLFIPAAAALPWAGRLPAAMALAMVVAALSLVSGVVLSTENDWPLSQSIVTAGAILVAGSYLLRAIMSLRRSKLET